MLAPLGKAGGYVATAIGLSLLATGLLVWGKIDQQTWRGFVEWVWTFLVGGGAIKALGDAWASRNGSASGPTLSGSPSSGG